jgi:hypothetical protein
VDHHPQFLRKTAEGKAKAKRRRAKDRLYKILEEAKS